MMCHSSIHRRIRLWTLISAGWVSPILSFAAVAHHPAFSALRMEATAYSSHSQPTTAGTVPHEGIVAADPSVLPLGSRIRVMNAGEYSGIYTVTDTGSKIRGRHIDVYIPSRAAAKQFGKKIVLVQVLETGRGKRDARDKDIPSLK